MRADFNPIVSIIGFDALEVLVQHYGGLTIRVPSGGGELYQAMADLIGDTAMRNLALYAGGTALYIPKGDESQRQQRNAQIISAHASGVPVSSIARRFGLSDRRIWAIIKDCAQTETYQTDKR